MVKVKWHQGSPFNNDVQAIHGKGVKTGCVATAVAQLCSTYDFPTHYRGIQLDWKLLTKNTSAEDYTGHEKQQFDKQVAAFLRQIGIKLGNQWGVKGTGARTENVRSVLKSMGYRHYSKFLDYDQWDVIRSLGNHSPVIMAGATDRKHNDGHCWLCDGLLTEEQIITRTELVEDSYGRRYYREVTSGSNYRFFLHCNWGWGGKCDGFFHPGVFDPEAAYLYDTVHIPKGSNHYRYDLKNILNIHP